MGTQRFFCSFLGAIHKWGPSRALVCWALRVRLDAARLGIDRPSHAVVHRRRAPPPARHTRLGAPRLPSRLTYATVPLLRAASQRLSHPLTCRRAPGRLAKQYPSRLAAALPAVGHKPPVCAVLVFPHILDFKGVGRAARPKCVRRKLGGGGLRVVWDGTKLGPVLEGKRGGAMTAGTGHGRWGTSAEDCWVTAPKYQHPARARGQAGCDSQARRRRQPLVPQAPTRHSARALPQPGPPGAMVGPSAPLTHPTRQRAITLAKKYLNKHMELHAAPMPCNLRVCSHGAYKGYQRGWGNRYQARVLPCGRC